MSQTAAPTFNDAALKAAKESEPVETEIKGITAKEPAPKVKREVAPPVEKRFTRDEITDAEGLISQEVGMLQSADRPGRYYDENEIGDYNPQKQQSSSRGVTAGGSWRGVTSMRNAMPFLKEHPDWTPGQLERALRNKDSAFYKRAMEAAVEFIRRENDKAKGEGVPF